MLTILIFFPPPKFAPKVTQNLENVKKDFYLLMDNAAVTHAISESIVGDDKQFQHILQKTSPLAKGRI